MRRGLLFSLLVLSSAANPIIIRHDVDDSKYRVPASEFLALADMPGEGHGVLIAPQWVVTAAHTTLWHPQEVTVNGVARKIERLVVYPGYKPLPDDLGSEALKTGDATKVVDFLAASDDIALIKLAAPVTDVAPATLYRRDDEMGKTVKLLGKGATGTGLTGMNPHDPHRTTLRRAFSRITRAEGHWLTYAFDGSPSALPLEGISSNGDSGGPVLIEADGQWQLAGLASWKDVKGHGLGHVGFYGQLSYNVRLFSYTTWIDGVIAADAAPRAAQAVPATAAHP